MKPSEEQAEQLLQKYTSGTASDREIRMVEHWYASESLRQQQDPLELDYLLVKAQLWSRISAQAAAPGRKQGQPRRYSLARRWAAAAAVVALVGAGIWFYAKKPGVSFSEGMAYANDVAPGTTSATLTLSSGKKILLSDAGHGELAREAGVSIVKTADGQLIYTADKGLAGSDKINTLSTANGQTYQVQLPDGTRAWLNAASSIAYPASFAALKTRNVQTTGEVYFEVAKDRLHPFIVSTRGQKVQVLGTHFNVNSYDDELGVRTTLLEGSVKIRGDSGSEGVLRPGEQALVSGDGGLKIAQVDAELATAWKDNKFMFDGESIEGVMRMVERWYDVQVVYTGDRPSETFVGGVSRFDKVSRVLRKLESTGSVHFKVEGRTIYVSK